MDRAASFALIKSAPNIGTAPRLDIPVRTEKRAVKIAWPSGIQTRFTINVQIGTESSVNALQEGERL